MLLACYVAVQRTFGTHGGITSMSEITPSPLLPQGMKSEIARRRFTSFDRRFGKAHLYLAQHAAFPLALTPDLLYRLWANFSRDVHRKQLNIPWVAVPDLLLSSLCNEVSQELYEMDVTVRNMLLGDLKADPNFGEQQIKELSDFLLAYIDQQLNSPDPDIRGFAHAQQWTALAYTKPGKAASKLAEALSKLDWSDKAEQMRMASLIETLAEQLSGFTPLLMYARGLAHLAHGEMEDAAVQFDKAAKGNQFVQVEGVVLAIPIPTQIQRGIGEALRLADSPPLDLKQESPLPQIEQPRNGAVYIRGFVNRAKELRIVEERCHALLEKNRPVQTQFIEFHGVGGIGKTTILKRLSFSVTREIYILSGQTPARVLSIFPMRLSIKCRRNMAYSLPRGAVIYLINLSVQRRLFWKRDLRFFLWIRWMQQARSSLTG